MSQRSSVPSGNTHIKWLDTKDTEFWLNEMPRRLLNSNPFSQGYREKGLFPFGAHQSFCRERAPSCGQWDKLTEEKVQGPHRVEPWFFLEAAPFVGPAPTPAEAEAGGQMWGPRVSTCE